MIVIFSKKKLIWNSGRGGLSANFSSNGNFVATPCFPLYKKDSIIGNVTQKPVHLLRSFIFSLCSEPLPVLDICSGSGSTSIACASLGIDSYSVDIRQSQIDASIHRMNFESIKPRWYPHPSIVHNFSVLDKFLKDSFEEPIPVVIKSPPKKSSKNQKSASQEVSSSHSEEGESSSDDEEDFNIMEESARLEEQARRIPKPVVRYEGADSDEDKRGELTKLETPESSEDEDPDSDDLDAIEDVEEEPEDEDFSLV
jgi:hypothetical protein